MGSGVWGAWGFSIPECSEQVPPLHDPGPRPPGQGPDAGQPACGAEAELPLGPCRAADRALGLTLGSFCLWLQEMAVFLHPAKGVSDFHISP